MIILSMRRFYLKRDEDVSGVSGTGIVAEGVVFSDGRTIIHWLGERQSVVVWNSVEDAVVIHGHGGKTTFVWVDQGGTTSV